jgi:hypothetical protein
MYKLIVEVGTLEYQIIKHKNTIYKDILYSLKQGGVDNMPLSKAIIPLYINTEILNNLYSIVIQEFVEIKSVSIKDQVAVHLKTPVSELSYDVFGKYVQGDFEIEYVNEYAKQRTEEKLSAVIIAMKNLRDILLQQNLLKIIEEPLIINDIKENDYVDFNCELRKNPVLQQVNDVINAMQIQRVFNANSDDNNETNAEEMRKSEMLKFFKNEYNRCINEQCIRYIGDNVCNSKNRAIVPLKASSMLDYEDYLLNGSVRVMGKVVKKNSYTNAKYDEVDSPLRMSIKSKTIFDHLDYNSLANIEKDMFNIWSNFNQNAYEISDEIDNIIEVLPIIIYI